MTSDRLNRKVFAWSNCMSLSHKCVKNWNFFVNKTFCDLKLSHFCNISQNVDTTFIVNSVMSRLFDKHANDWHNCLSLERSVSGRGENKLRTYRLFKNSFETEIYCKIALPFSYRSAFAKLDVELNHLE